ncbi:MAG: dockerin type I repeat-containing protein [Ruminococcus sp.]|uniref:dockerin type I repeat-containing protein n=1 Tax=Ruminococcus sp. TaxID=41978 RepID=UPI0025E53DA2|nr:dockerin type I repeat-containing protein [Ruminococcus sp.]MCR5601980.1 dockerin type I repeat-containing protein [Ruminococcus sp.]
MKITKMVAGLFASAVMACSLTAFTASADSYSIKFMKGDLNGDEVINVTDMTIMNAHFKLIKPIDDLTVADLNWDGKVNVTDRVLMSQHIKCQKAIHTGDADGDKAVTTDDVRAISNHIMGRKALSKSGQYAADVNGDGKINVTDIAKISNYLNN